MRCASKRFGRKKSGMRVMQIVTATGLSWTSVRMALNLYEQGGMAALKPSVRGKKPGTGRSLSAEQEQTLQRIIYDKRPEQLKMDFALWSRPAVMQLIEREYDIKLPVHSVSKHLTRWGFTRQKPIKTRKQLSSALRPFENGRMKSIQRLSNAPKPKAPRFTGVMKPPWSIPMYAAAAMLQSAKRRWPMLLAVPARNS